MKVEEAIEKLKTIYEVKARDDEKEGVCYVIESDREPLEIAIKAMEKQVAEEVRYEYDGYADGNPVYDVAYCPICNVCFENGDDNWGKNYCPECGQKLKWEEEE